MTRDEAEDLLHEWWYEVRGSLASQKKRARIIDAMVAASHPRTPEVRPMELREPTNVHCALCGAVDRAHPPADCIKNLRARLRDAEAREKRYREALERIEATEGEASERGCHGCGRGVDDCDADDALEGTRNECHGRIARRALTSPADLGEQKLAGTGHTRDKGGGA